MLYKDIYTIHNAILALGKIAHTEEALKTVRKCSRRDYYEDLKDFYIVAIDDLIGKCVNAAEEVYQKILDRSHYSGEELYVVEVIE